MKCTECLSENERGEYCSRCGMNFTDSNYTKNLFALYMIRLRKIFKIVIVLAFIAIGFLIASFVTKDSLSETLDLISSIITDVLVFVCAILLVFFGSKISKVKGFKTVKGKVIETYKKKSNSLMVIEYEANNKKYRVVSGATAKLGEEIDVKYNPQNPYTAMDTKLISIWKILFIIGIVLIVTSIAGIALYFI